MTTPTPAAPSAFDWTDAYLLGDAGMDHTHREFVERLDALLRAHEADMLAQLDALIEHIEAHFADENAAMQRTDFPARACHMDEHAAVLRSAHGVRERLALHGDVQACRRLAQALADWFPAHTDHLDSALAHWLCKLRAGGKPVVLRRNILDTADIA